MKKRLALREQEPAKACARRCITLLMEKNINPTNNSQPWQMPRLEDAADALTECFGQINEGLDRIEQKADAVLKMQDDLRRWCR